MHITTPATIYMDMCLCQKSVFSWASLLLLSIVLFKREYYQTLKTLLLIYYFFKNKILKSNNKAVKLIAVRFVGWHPPILWVVKGLTLSPLQLCLPFKWILDHVPDTSEQSLPPGSLPLVHETSAACLPHQKERYYAQTVNTTTLTFCAPKRQKLKINWNRHFSQDTS